MPTPSQRPASKGAGVLSRKATTDPVSRSAHKFCEHPTASKRRLRKFCAFRCPRSPPVHWETHCYFERSNLWLSRPMDRLLSSLPHYHVIPRGQTCVGGKGRQMSIQLPMSWSETLTRRFSARSPVKLHPRYHRIVTATEAFLWPRSIVSSFHTSDPSE